MSQSEEPLTFTKGFKAWLNSPGGLTAFQEALTKLGTVAVMAVAFFGLSTIFSKFTSPVTKNDLVTRIEELNKALTSAARTIDQIEKEVNQRRALVDRLNRDAELASKLAALDKEQADAVAQVLRLQLEADQSFRFWVNIAQSAIFLILGLAAGELYRFVKRRIRRRRAASQS